MVYMCARVHKTKMAYGLNIKKKSSTSHILIGFRLLVNVYLSIDCQVRRLIWGGIIGVYVHGWYIGAILQAATIRRDKQIRRRVSCRPLSEPSRHRRPRPPVHACPLHYLYLKALTPPTLCYSHIQLNIFDLIKWTAVHSFVEYCYIIKLICPIIGHS